MNGVSDGNGGAYLFVVVSSSFVAGIARGGSGGGKKLVVVWSLIAAGGALGGAKRSFKSPERGAVWDRFFVRRVSSADRSFCCCNNSCIALDGSLLDDSLSPDAPVDDDVGSMMIVCSMTQLSSALILC